MDYGEFKRRLGKAGLTTGEFADLVGMRRNSLTNYSKSGEIPTHLAVIATLMSEMADAEVDFREPLRRLDLSPRKARGASSEGRFGGDPQRTLRLPFNNEGDTDEQH